MTASDSIRWHPRLGACPESGATRFRVWAPEKKTVEVIVETRRAAPFALSPEADGTFAGSVSGVGPGDRYRYRIDGEGPFPDPASRFQPEGVHGASEIVDARSFQWTDGAWAGIDRDQLAIYELHTGTFSTAGTFAALIDRLPYLRDLGVTAVELMPVADFAGYRNWGYDGVSLFAPSRCYGRPDDLRRCVDVAHRLGLAVVLDVVYNHLGPDGVYLGRFSPYYFTERHHTPWGAAVNLDGANSGPVRDFFVENALHWLHEYHVDGLRLDATHALFDDGPVHFLAELSERIHACGRNAFLIAEDHRNLAAMIRPRAAGGWGLDGVWADDLHHEVRRKLAGDREGYYRDYSGSAADIAETIRRGWFYRGQYSEHSGARRGTDPSGVPPRRFVVCLQNHDQVGNRAFGERLNHRIDLAAYRAAVALLLCCPETPLLFMGQEWAATSPFLYFTDHNPELGKLVTAGRRREFKAFAAFADPKVRETIPDPQAQETFERSRLDWSETGKEPHASLLRLHRALLALRRTEALLKNPTWDGFSCRAAGEDAIVMVRTGSEGETLIVAVQLNGAGRVDVTDGGTLLPHADWETVLTTEDPAFAPEPHPVRVDAKTGTIEFARPGAAIIKA